ncbi:hypothetical protein [uncultured Flavobacterium sp.]|uniref:hypothetical protein n=1 Tax=uncultured Flavobacterium sp. TaxID=165435 RepID=UPI0030ED2DC7|tara:strand:+ start:56740 stop:57150 length:411 start_codon:yes stop_codon:yes gene_type:complete
MTLKDKTISKGFIIAGIMNSSVLLFSRLFTNATIPKFDPTVMSNFGLLMIFIWGLAYLSVAKNFKNVKWLIGIFAVEKFIYGYIWINWLLNNNISAVFEKDSMAGIFYAIYGVNDWLFFIFFSFVFVRLMRFGDHK